jgi:trehalose synthase
MTTVSPGPDTPPAQHPRQVDIGSQPLTRLVQLIGVKGIEEAQRRAVEVRDRLSGRVVWNVNSTAEGGGVAEMLHFLLPYARGLGIDARWAVLAGTPEFFRITKRLHHALHGSAGDGTPLGNEARATYEAVLRRNAEELVTAIRPGDIAILHDPQTAGLIPTLIHHGAHVAWRCHVGAEAPGPEVTTGWDFLEPYVSRSEINIFSRPQYVPDCCDHGRTIIIQPSIDPFSPKNQDMEDTVARAILAHAGIIGRPDDHDVPTFTRQDGSPGRVDRYADVTQLGPSPSWDTPLVVQVSRWDPLKDPAGVIRGFVEFHHLNHDTDAHLVLAGPNVTAIPDDPEQAETLDALEKQWRALPHSVRSRVHLACLPMADLEENAAIVNALQRHATIVVQKSLAEGFGLTVTEAMWKARPVVASAVGGIQDQIEDGVHGLLLQDPRDSTAFATALKRLFDDPGLRKTLGENARERVREQFLPLRQIMQYADLIERLDLRPAA